VFLSNTLIGKEMHYSDNNTLMRSLCPSVSVRLSVTLMHPDEGKTRLDRMRCHSAWKHSLCVREYQDRNTTDSITPPRRRRRFVSGGCCSNSQYITHSAREERKSERVCEALSSCPTPDRRVQIQSVLRLHYTLCTRQHENTLRANSRIYWKQTCVFLHVSAIVLSFFNLVVIFLRLLAIAQFNTKYTLVAEIFRKLWNWCRIKMVFCKMTLDVA